MRSMGQPVLQATFDEGANDDGDVSDAALMLQQGSTIQRVQTQYAGAITVQKPRNRKDVQKAVLEEAELAGEDFFYSWTTQNKDGTRGLVEGISIEGAMIMARCWGNCAIPTELAQEGPSHWILSATFVDLETGFNVPRLFRQRKNQTAGGKMDKDRAMDIAFQIGQSKAQRNAIDKAMPTWLKEAALAKAKATSEGRFRDVAKSNKEALASFGKWGITQQQLEEKLGLPIEQWTARDHVSLSGLYRAIRDRQTSVREEFPPPASEQATAENQAKPAYDGSASADPPTATSSSDVSPSTEAKPPSVADGAEPPKDKETKKKPVPREPGQEG
jgi:hypothetical protein